MSGKVILSLDLAMQTGFCVGIPGQKPKSGSVSFRAASPHPGAVSCVVADWLAPMLDAYKPWRVIYEAPLMMIPEKENGRGGSAKTLRRLLAYADVVDMLTCRWGIGVVQSASQTARKHFVGHGRPENPKDVVFAECVRRGLKPTDHNEADAICLWFLACFTYFPDDYRYNYLSSAQK